MNDYAVSTFIWLWQKVCERAHVSDRVCVCHVLAVTATATNIIGGDFDGNGGGDGDSKNHQNQFQSLKAPKKTEFQRSPSPTVYVLCWRKQTNSRRHRAPLMECGRPNFKLIHFEWNTKLYIYISTLAINFNFPFLIPKLKCISMRPRPYCFRGDFIPIYVSLSSIELTTVVCGATWTSTTTHFIGHQYFSSRLCCCYYTSKWTKCCMNTIRLCAVCACPRPFVN